MIISPSDVIEALGNRLTYVVRGDQTQGTFSVIDFEVAPSFTAPPLVHRNTREDWWARVTEGEIAMELAGNRVTCPTGSTVFVPRDTTFRWWNPNPTRAAWTITYAPAGFERYFVELAEAIARAKPPLDLGALAGPLWAKYGIEMTPPA